LQQPGTTTSCCSSKSQPDLTEGAGATDKSDRRLLEVELLALDLDTCDRCTGTDATIEAAVRDLHPIMVEAGVDLRFHKTVVSTVDQATALRFQSSPTIRIDGQDLPIEFRESRCGDCTTMCGGAAATDCRVWVWRGREYNVAPKGLIVDAILRAYASVGAEPMPAPDNFVLPDNLRRFFEARAANPTARANTPSAAKPCCDRSGCCAPEERIACCGAGAATGKDACGCKTQ